MICKRVCVFFMVFVFSCALAIACGGNVDGVSSDDATPKYNQSSIFAPGSMDPLGRFEPPKEITIVTIPQFSDMRFSKGATVTTKVDGYGRGDLRVMTTTGGWAFFTIAEQFQGGLQDLGEITDPLDQIEHPQSGYILGDKVPAIKAHVYAVKSRDDEPDHFIIVRVKEFGEQSDGTPTITLEYFYR